MSCQTMPPTTSDMVNTDSNLDLPRSASDISLVNHKDTQLVAICSSGRGIICFDKTFNKSLWAIKGAFRECDAEMKVEGVTTDDMGHIFVCDSKNSCIRIFSTSGIYTDTILRDGEAGLGQLLKAKWCSTTGSLVVAHCVEGKINLTALKLDLKESGCNGK